MTDHVASVIIDRYQEQPHLLDPHLSEPGILYMQISLTDAFFGCTGTIVSQLLPMAKQTSWTALSQQAFRYLYLLSKVRGPKVILRWFSHEVADLEPVLSLLEGQNSAHYQVVWTVFNRRGFRLNFVAVVMAISPNRDLSLMVEPHILLCFTICHVDLKVSQFYTFGLLGFIVICITMATKLIVDKSGLYLYGYILSSDVGVTLYSAPVALHHNHDSI